VRISPATAKFKQQSIPGLDLPQVQFPAPATGATESQPSVTVAVPIPGAAHTKSVSAPIAATASATPGSGNNVSASGSGTSVSGSHSLPSLSSGSVSSNNVASSISPVDLLKFPQDVLAQIAQRYASESANAPKPVTAPVQSSVSASFAQPEVQDLNGSAAPKYLVSEESWKHHAQARAILGNLIGPNGEQLTSTDPYNTTVFVGGLSPLISEETLRTFFAPFGDIHYVSRSHNPLAIRLI
jgi:hypothetical protein